MIAISIASAIHTRALMKTVQMTLEPELVTQVDRVARRLGLTRSAFTRRALRAALEQLRVQELERRHRDGYRRKPVRRGEFDVWTSEQMWPD
jgi:hypothetical protein